MQPNRSSWKILTLKNIGTGSTLLIGGIILGSGFLSAEPPPHDGLASCQRYATQWYQQENPDTFQSITLSKQDLNEEKYEGKVGTQFVSTLLSGQGTLHYKGESPSPVQFTCLLENDQKAVFFHTTESQKPDAAKTCWANFQPGDWSGLQNCLKQALNQEETQLKDLQTQATTWAQKVDERWQQAQAKSKLTQSVTQWQNYRDQECDRQDAFRTGGNHPDVSRLECLLRKTEQRIQDFHSEEGQP